MDLSTIIDGSIQRLDINGNVRVVVTLNLAGSKKFIADYFLNDDVQAFKNGTAAERNALRKKYIRQAVASYLQTIQSPPAPIDQGTQSVPKAAFSDPGDT